MTVLFLVVCFAAFYQLLAILGAILHMLSKEPAPASLPPVSILKPLCGLDPHLREALLSHIHLDYPEFEVLVGAADPGDPGLHLARSLADAAPPGRVRIFTGAAPAANRKVGLLAELARHACHPLILVTDSDIEVPPDLLRRTVPYLENTRLALVTCLYRGNATTWPGRWEALGLSTDFIVSVLAARLLGVRNVGFGAALLFRAPDLAAIGGFQALASFLADDFQLAVRLASGGRSVALAKVVVSTWLGESSWRAAWKHQLRWARTVRVSKPKGYAGLILANGSFWALVGFLAGAWPYGLALLGLRLAAGLLVGGLMLRSRDAVRYWFLVPLRDLWGVAVWVGGLLGSTVEWRGQRLRLLAGGQIECVASPTGPSTGAGSFRLG